MPLILLPATIDDLPTLTKLHFEVFLPTCAITSLIYPSGATQTILDSEIAARTEHFSEPHIYYMKVVDLESNTKQTDRTETFNSSNSRIIAYARWYVWNEGRPEEEWDCPQIKGGIKGVVKDVDMEIETKYRFWLKEQKRRLIQGQKHIYLSLLATSLADQGRGCGTMLLNWGLEMAKIQGLDCFLQAAPSAHHFYRNRGFTDVSFFDLDTGSVRDGEVDDNLAPCTRILMQYKVNHL